MIPISKEAFEFFNQRQVNDLGRQQIDEVKTRSAVLFDMIAWINNTTVVHNPEVIRLLNHAKTQLELTAMTLVKAISRAQSEGNATAGPVSTGTESPTSGEEARS